ncbi:response regulator transcription factor [Limibaculum sp. M0105]|uniref:Response regulator transcription factor n=2 Tax=Thermohalobaculum xanthum TaxID=2753746 RepID=A0A8J7M4M7_9RHOB|nr:response regulator transcription factor [Thermohalobaculum xanthum]
MLTAMAAMTQRRVLAVDDDRHLCAALGRILKDEGYGFRAAQDGPSMRRALADERFDLVILDINFPSGEDGISLARGLRTQHDLPLIMLSGKDNTIDKVVCLELGADDYVTKPFEPRELVARVRTVLRRYGRQPGSSHALPAGSGDTGEIWHFAGWQLDATTLSLVPPEGGPVRLTGQEFQLLKALVVRRGRVLSREQILDIVSHRQWTPYDRSIDVLIAKLRRKLDDHAGRSKIIRTIRGVGYTFVPRVDVSEASEDVTQGK